MNSYNDMLNRFLKYVKINTQSDEQSESIPSSKREVIFIDMLKDELTSIGLDNVRINSQSGYLFANLPSNVEGYLPKIGFIAHVDTADFNSENINPQVIERYDGNVIKLGTSEYRLDPQVFKSLNKYVGDTLITTDGNTLLGADDKAGVTEIITAVQYLIDHPEVPHGEIIIGFGPDEEIGTGADHFDVQDFNADIAYTVDGGPLGDLQYETFNAASAKLVISGTDVHPAEAKGIMVNALQLGMDFHNQLPKHDRPELTDGREGFFFLTDMHGTPDQAVLNYIIRDHDRDAFESRKQLFQGIVNTINAQYSGQRIQLTLKDQYYNMAEVIKKDMTVVDLAKQAMLNLDIKPNIFPVRGGTDGSKISFMGIPTPNLFAGGENMHGRFEYVSLQTMEKAVDLIIEVAKLNTKNI
ncbi:peptidase T [Apilactobacillus xinyiensis]|uniref:Peptidase T n=1 Tax=Apilactobacillus xinyiensis TaxID=2841032 RepID=A0ABT0I0L7_9LACO|nr:peptidase T [Apilactobacillus xinyiensis]MCK8624071.1 peptidase T [Apilactobacillus xinyiensis]MCL0318192.1 peptidase T [Apilactobacillus xinyiensis]MCL0329349.1 peptidase T [Apilactobacillus xinyiensis]